MPSAFVSKLKESDIWEFPERLKVAVESMNNAERNLVRHIGNAQQNKIYFSYSDFASFITIEQFTMAIGGLYTAEIIEEKLTDNTLEINRGKNFSKISVHVK